MNWQKRKTKIEKSTKNCVIHGMEKEREEWKLQRQQWEEKRKIFDKKGQNGEKDWKSRKRKKNNIKINDVNCTETEEMSFKEATEQFKQQNLK